MTDKNLEIIILAAGAGSRMYSERPKVLQPLAGQPLLFHVLKTALQLQPLKIHVVLATKQMRSKRPSLLLRTLIGLFRSSN